MQYNYYSSGAAYWRDGILNGSYVIDTLVAGVWTNVITITY